MTAVEALVTAARRYCATNYAYWSEQYAVRRTGNSFPYTYTDSDYDLFPRYNALYAIQQGVECLVGRTDGSIGEVKDELSAIGANAQGPSTQGEQSPIAMHAMHDERSKFIAYIQSLTELDLLQVEELPYRRRLSEEERNVIRNHLDKTWSFKGGYWAPLVEVDRPTVFLAFDALTDQDSSAIAGFIRDAAQSRLLELTEFGPDYEVDSDEFDTDLYETLICDRTMEWVVYGSHESTLAFGGAPLIAFVERLFAARRELLNKWPEYLGPAMK